MGHADLSTTMRYVHHIPQHDAAKRLSSVFGVEVNPLPRHPGVRNQPAPCFASR
jgi:hypothetical protein